MTIRTVKDRRAEKLVPWLVGACLALPSLVVHYPPMKDLPLHEAAVGLMRHWNAPAFAQHDVYALNLGHPNQLFYGLIWAFSYAFSDLTVASKLTVALSVLILPVAAARVAAYLKRSIWPALLVAPLGLGWLYYWGLIANILGISGLLLVLIPLDRHLRRPGMRTMLVLLGWFVLLYFAHVAALMCALIPLGIGAVSVRSRGWRVLGLRIAPGVVVMAGLAVHAEWSKHLLRFTIANRPGPAIISRIREIPTVLLSAFEPWAQYTIFFAIMALLAWSCVLLRASIPKVSFASCSASAMRPALFSRQVRGKFFRYRYEASCAVLLGMFLVLPAASGGATLVYHRFLPISWALAVVLVSPFRRAPFPNLLKMANLAVVLGILFINIPHFIEANATFAGFEPVINNIAIGSPVSVTSISSLNGAKFSVGAMAGAVVGRRGGRTGFDFTQSAMAPVYQTEACDWPITRERYVRGIHEFRPAYDMRRFRYVVIYAVEPYAREVLTDALRAEARLIDASDRWYLFESILKVRALCDFDWKMPDPAPERLFERLRRMANASSPTVLPLPPPTSNAIGLE
jgi:hypothetical protein